MSDHARGPLIAVRFTGVYPSGSAGNRCAETMMQFLRNVLIETRAAGVIFDFTQLDYDSGDAIGGLAMPLVDEAQRFRPAAIVATHSTASCLTPLLEPNLPLGLAGIKLFRTTEEALRYIEQAIDRREQLP